MEHGGVSEIDAAAFGKFSAGLGAEGVDDKWSPHVTWVEMSSLRSLHGGMWVWKPPGPVGLFFSP